MSCFRAVWLLSLFRQFHATQFSSDVWALDVFLAQSQQSQQGVATPIARAGIELPQSVYQKPPLSPGRLAPIIQPSSVGQFAPSRFGQASLAVPSPQVIPWPVAHAPQVSILQVPGAATSDQQRLQQAVARNQVLKEQVSREIASVQQLGAGSFVQTPQQATFLQNTHLGRHREIPDESLSGLILLTIGGMLALASCAFHIVAHKYHGALIEDKGADEPQDMDLDSPCDTVAEGNLFRLLAKNAELLRHQEDIHTQLKMLSQAPELQDTLDTAAWEEIFTPGRGKHQEPVNVRDKQYQRLTRLLWLALNDKIEYAKEARAQQGEQGSASGSVSGDVSSRVCPGLELLRDLVSRGQTKRILFKSVLMPTDPGQLSVWLKNRFMAALISTIMILAPLLIMHAKLHDDDANMYKQQMQGDLNVWEIVCVGTTDLSVTVLGVCFLVIIIEYARSVSKVELSSMKKMQYLPADTFWLRMGQFSNAMCILFTVLVMPLIYWSEEAPENIVFDSMAILFIFSLDDLGSEAAAYLEMEQDTFQLGYCTLVKGLETCPLHLDCLIDASATDYKKLWVLDDWPIDPTRASRDEQDARREEYPPRLIRPPRSSPDDPPRELKIEYWVSGVEKSQNSLILGTGQRDLALASNLMWVSVAWSLLVLEVVLPILYVFLGKPCYNTPPENNPPMSFGQLS